MIKEISYLIKTALIFFPLIKLIFGLILRNSWHIGFLLHKMIERNAMKNTSTENVKFWKNKIIFLTQL